MVAATASAADMTPGLLVRLYDIGVDVPSLPELAPDQKPNVVLVVPTLDLRSDRRDFEPLENRFLTEVVGVLTVDKAGTYRFRLLSDDGSKLWLDRKLLIDNDGLHGPTPKDSEPIDLIAGPHKLHVWHLQAGGGAQLTLQWQAPGAAGDKWDAIPAALLSHAADASKETASGQKKIIPPLRRGKPGDGLPVGKSHPGYAPAGSAPFGDENLNSWPTDGRLRVIGEPLTPTNANFLGWLPADVGKLINPAVANWAGAPERGAGVLVQGGAGGEAMRVYLDGGSYGIRACAFRLGRESAQALRETGTIIFEMLAVRAMSNGFEIEFTKPLDKRVGWDPESYYIEQWPFDVAKSVGPHRDGVVYPVKSASVSPDRKKVFLEIPDLKISHVVYIRLLPPCISEDGELPWSTEAWYTLNAIPTDRKGEVLTPPAPEKQNFLTDEEKQQGWKLLFDGQTPRGWHVYKKDVSPAGWQVKDGCLVRAAPAGDIATDEDFQDFELSLEWRISPGGNSGVMYRVTEDHGAPYETGPEYQILDNGEHPDGRDPLTSAASCYALYAPPRDVTVPVGFFNKARIVVQGNHVEHWLSGVKVVEYELHSPEWDALVKASKFSKMPDYGTRPKGKIDLQDHGDKVWFRNIKIRTKN
jgi:hypothetical protein